ncbi:MAG TPA: extracellular solute-binding protein [Candidatus Acidoferrum sp.]|nr:extracellular solute-binding protein [Candidatus Acidoferrum sp.]
MTPPSVSSTQARPFQPSRFVIIISLLGLSQIFFALGCSKQPSQEPVTVTFLDVEWDTSTLNPGLGHELQEFTRKTGIQVNRLPRPDGSLNQLVLWRKLLQKGAAAPDVVSIDVIWPGILSEYLMDLKPYLAAELSSQNPVVLASYTVGDKLVAIPHHAYVAVLYYRPSLLRKYGYPEPPKTWDELERMATRIQAGERAKGRKDFWGYVWQGGVTEDLTCSGLEWQISEAGGRIIEDDRTISVNNPQVIRAWKRAAHWVGSISPPGVTAYALWDAQNLWGSGNAAFLRGWQSDYSVITGGWPFSGSPSSAENSAQVGLTSVPGGKAGRASTLGGNGLAISRTSTHPREALELIRFLLQGDAQLTTGNEHSVPPEEVEFYELPAMLDPYPQLAKFKQRGGGLVARPSIVAGEKYEQVSRAYIGSVRSVLTGEKIPSVAAADLERQLVEITGFSPGPPSKLN